VSGLHVLVIGPLTGGACNVYRFGMHRAALAALGVELRAFAGARMAVPMRDAGSLDAAYASPDLVVDRSELDWADVIVFRRFYSTHWTCLDCAFVGDRESTAREHATSVGHELSEPDRLLRPLFRALEEYPELLRGRAMVYETDDDLLNVQPWNGMRLRIAPERDVIERMMRRADLVTVSTPALRTRLAPYNDEIRVLRNAVDPSWYRAPDAPAVSGSPRLLYYGSPARFRDYEVCRPAVDLVVRETPGARRVWLGALNARAGGAPQRVMAAVDEVGPFIQDTQDFAAALVAARPDIGLAPLVGDTFDRAKSELHWLEYTMAGAATIASRTAGDGPYSPIRHGVDGLLVDGTAEWIDALRRVASAPALREDLTARARERVLAEYSAEARASEWADAYRWAAEHPGRRVEGRVHGLGALDGRALAGHGRASLEHRAWSREALDAAPARLEAARADGVSCGAPAGAAPSLVSVVVPVLDEPPEAVRSAVESAVRGTYRHIEVVVAASAAWRAQPGTDGSDIARDDARVRHITVDEADEPILALDAPRAARTGRLLAAGVTAARGAWIAPLAPDAAFSPDHVEVLLGVAEEHRLEFVYGHAEVTPPVGAPVVLGTWPPSQDEVLTLASELFAAPLTSVVPLDPAAWRDGDTTGWAFWRAMLTAGARMAGIEYVVATVSPPAGQPGDDRPGAQDVGSAAELALSGVQAVPASAPARTAGRTAGRGRHQRRRRG
jgi:glycosyltransferase involved in cell wall biosynthesis